MKKPIDVDAYISGFPTETQKLLEQLRTIIKKAAPKAEEVISYHMPAYKYKGVLAYFAGYNKHIGFYPTPSVITHFRNEISVYKHAKGSVQFPLDRPLPIQLISRMIAFRMKETLVKAAIKEKKK